MNEVQVEQRTKYGSSMQVAAVGGLEMTRDELEHVHIRGGAFFDRIQLFLDFETGERVKEIYRVERIIDRFERYDPKIDGRCGLFEVASPEYWRVGVLTEDGTEKELEIHNAMFGPAYKPFLGIFAPATIGRALYWADQSKPPEQRKAGL